MQIVTPKYFADSVLVTEKKSVTECSLENTDPGRVETFETFKCIKVKTKLRR